MITLRQVVLQRGDKRLLDRVDLTIVARQKVGITGANGCGKSSLLALIRGELHAESGDVELQPGLRMSSVAQETPNSASPAIEFVLDGDRGMREIERAIEGAERAGDAHALAALHARYDEMDGYTARARAARILDGLGFVQAEHARAVSAFSGGWRMRLALAQALMCPSDLLLLDEPTNHLDLDAVLWLEAWLQRYPGTLLMISHDREFLDATVQAICHIEQRGLKLYRGTYSEFEQQRAASLAHQQAAFEKQQREIAHLHRFVERFRAKATKARQAQSRLKALDRMERIAPAHVDTPFSFAFGAPAPVSHLLLQLEDVAAGYGERAVLSGVKLDLVAGARIGLLGANGAGKSTLIKLLAGRAAPLAGARREGKGLKVGYFAQHQLEQLRPDESPLQHMLRADPGAREQDLRDYLGGFDFRAATVDAPAGRFSGGEKARLTLALIIWQRPNLLLLDEPTNHLDLEMRHALTMALQEFEGALVLVSHDRFLLRSVADSLLLVANGAVAPFDGDLDDYRAWLEGRRRQASPGQPESPRAGGSRREQRRLEAQERDRQSARRRPVEQRLRAVEQELEQIGVHRRRLETEASDPKLYEPGNRDRLKAALLEQSQVTARLQTLETEWLELQTQLETLEAQ
jgi:ATP-binding cassette subfamily F protein 3